MRVCCIYDEKNDKYVKLALDIYKYFEKAKDEICKYDISKGIGSKDDIYLYFSDNAEELKKFYEDSQKPDKVMILTDNLSVEYIMACTDIAKNICYSKKEVKDICFRIELMYEKDNICS